MPQSPQNGSYPYPNQPPAPYAPTGAMPSTQPQYQQYGQYAGGPAMPQYQPPANYQQHNRPVPLPPPPPVKKTPYDFFMQQKHPTNTKAPIPGPKQAGFKGKLIWIAGGAIAIMLVIVVIGALTPKDTTSQNLIIVAQTQQEVVRVCSQGSDKAKAQANRNLAINCSLSVGSDQAQLVAYLAKQGVKVTTKQLSLSINASNTSALTAATATSNYDDVFKTVATKQLTAYANVLQQQLAAGQLGANAQTLLGNQLAHVKILLGTK